MKRFLLFSVLAVSLLTFTISADAALNSLQLGSNPVAGSVLQTNGATSTWVATSSLGLGGGGGGGSTTNVFGVSPIVVNQSGVNATASCPTCIATNTGNWNGLWLNRTTTDYLASTTVVNTPSTTIPTIFVITFNGSSGTTTYGVTSANAFISLATSTSNATLTYSSSSLNLGSISVKPATDYLVSSTVVNTPSTTIPITYVATLNGASGTYNLYVAGAPLSITTGTASSTITWTNQGYLANASITAVAPITWSAGNSIGFNTSTALSLSGLYTFIGGLTINSTATFNSSTIFSNVTSSLVLTNASGAISAYTSSTTSGGANCLTSVTISATGTLTNTNATCSGGSSGFTNANASSGIAVTTSTSLISIQNIGVTALTSAAPLTTNTSATGTVTINFTNPGYVTAASSVTWTALQTMNLGLTVNSTSTFNSSTIFSVATATILSADSTGKVQTTTFGGIGLSFSGNTLTWANPGYLTNASITANSPLAWTSTSTITCATCLTANAITTSSAPTSFYFPYWANATGGLSGTSSIYYLSATSTGFYTTVPLGYVDILPSVNLPVTTSTQYIFRTDPVFTGNPTTTAQNEYIHYNVPLVGLTNPTSTITNLYNHYVKLDAETGTISNVYGFYADKPTTTASSTITNLWAFFTPNGGGQSQFQSSTIYGPLTTASTTNALLLANGTGLISGYAGASACGAGNAITTISAQGTTTCSAFLTANAITTSSAVTTNQFPFWASANQLSGTSTLTNVSGNLNATGTLTISSGTYTGGLLNVSSTGNVVGNFTAATTTIGTSTAVTSNVFTVVANNIQTFAVTSSTEASSTYRLVVSNNATTTNLTASNTLLFGVTSSGIPMFLGSSTVAIGGASLAAGACTSTVTIINYPLSTSTDVVAVTPQSDPGGSFIPRGFITATGNATSGVTVEVCAAVLGTPTATAYNFTVSRATYAATTTPP